MSQSPSLLNSAERFGAPDMPSMLMKDDGKGSSLFRQVEFGRVIGVETALEPADAQLQSSWHEEYQCVCVCARVSRLAWTVCRRSPIATPICRNRYKWR